MRVDRARLALAALLVSLVFAVLSLLYWDFIRDTIVVPLYYLLWVSDLMLKSIPHGVYLALLVLICISISLNTLAGIRRSQNTRVVVRSPVQTHSRFRHWRSLWRNISASQFSRNQFQSDARRLVLAIIAYEQGIDPSEAEMWVRNNKISVPEAIKTLVEKEEIHTQQPASGLLVRILRRLRLLTPPPMDPKLERLVAEFIGFIEQHGEITYGGHRHQP